MPNMEAVSDGLKIPSPLTELRSSLLDQKKIKLYLKRDDLIHADISGNKWRKLHLNILEAKAQNKDTIVTFGGAFSNHIYATAAACKLFGLKSIGIIRGEYADPNNPTLKFAQSNGMEIVPVSKVIYGSDKMALAMQYPAAYAIPEGGNNELGREGMKFLAEEINTMFEKQDALVVTPIGTACTMSGLVQYLADDFSVLGVNVLRNKGIDGELLEWTKGTKLSYEVNHDYHFGGYARTKPELIDFANRFSAEHGICLDPIYTAKMMFALFDLIERDKFPEGKTIIAIHTGGLQGIIPYNLMNDHKIKLIK